MSGYNGEKVHDKAKEVMEKYSKWYKGWSLGLWCLISNPNKRLFSMPTCTQLDKMICDTESFYQSNKNKHKNEIYNEYQLFTSIKKDM